MPESEIICIGVAFSLHCWEFKEAYLETKKVSMGILIEQYRSSIGSHDNLVKTKDILSRFNDHFWSSMFVMFYLIVLNKLLDNEEM